MLPVGGARGRPRDHRRHRRPFGQAGLCEQAEGAVPDRRGGGFDHREQPGPHAGQRPAVRARAAQAAREALEHGRAPPLGAGSGGAIDERGDLGRTAARADDSGRLTEERGAARPLAGDEGGAGRERAVEVRHGLVGRRAQRRHLDPLVLDAGAEQPVARGPRGGGVEAAQRAQQLEANARIVVARHRQQALGQAGIARQERLGQPDRVLAHARHRVAQGRKHDGGVQLSESLQRPERVQPGVGGRALANGPRQEPGSLRRLPVHQEPLRGPPPPEVRMREHADELFGRGVAGPPRGRGRRSLRLGGDAVDAAAIAALVQRGRIMVVVGDAPLRVLDDRPVVVHEVDRVVGPGGEVHGPEPGVARGQELAAVLRATGHERGSGGRPDVAVNEVMGRLRHQGRPAQGRGQGAAGHERQAAGRGELAGLAQHLELGVPRDGVDHGRGAVVGHVLHRRAQQQVRVALQVARGDHLVARVVRVVEGEVAAPLVERVTEL